MSNTIELLETIGRNASLRHACANDLVQKLAGMQASEQLKQAAASGNSGHLEAELGHRIMKVNKNPIQGGCEDEGNEKDSIPGQGGDNENDPSSK